MSDTPVTHIRMYRDTADEWRWTAVAANGEPVADSGEGYANRAHALDMAARLFPGAVVEVDE